MSAFQYLSIDCQYKHSTRVTDTCIKYLTGWQRDCYLEIYAVKDLLPRLSKYRIKQSSMKSVEDFSERGYVNLLYLESKYLIFHCINVTYEIKALDIILLLFDFSINSKHRLFPSLRQLHHLNGTNHFKEYRQNRILMYCTCNSYSKFGKLSNIALPIWSD